MCNYGCKITNKFLFVCGFYVKLCDFVMSNCVVRGFDALYECCIYEKSGQVKNLSALCGR